MSDSNDVAVNDQTEEQEDVGVVASDFDDVVEAVVDEVLEEKDAAPKPEENVKSDSPIPTAPVPYDRFKEVIEEKNRLASELAALQSSARQTDVKPKEEVPKQSADEMPNLNEEQLKVLQESNPKLYDVYIAEKREQELIKKVELRQQKNNEEREKEANRIQYLKMHEDRVFKDFPEVKNPDSDWFKKTAPEIQKLAAIVPAISVDPAVWHLGLRVIELERKLANNREAVKKEVEEEVRQKRADKKSAALSGQASTMPSRKHNDALSDFDGPASWEKN